jgi:signal transduction histidine kinase
MSEKKGSIKKTRSFSLIFLGYMVVLVLCIVGFMAIVDYTYTKNNFEYESLLLQTQTEQHMIEAMRFEDATWSIYDGTLNDQMKEGLQTILLEYNQSDGNPSAMDLTRIKKELGVNYDIYIINESGVIIATTYQSELGMDFKQVPYFYAYLTKIRMSEGFFPDRIVRDKLGTGQFRKFAYYPTPDHRFILELGLAGSSFTELNLQLNEQASINKIASVNPYVEDFAVYNTMGRRIDTNDVPDKSVQVYIDDIIANRKTLEVSDPEHARKTRFIFVDLAVDKYGSDPSRIIEINYNTRSIQDALTQLMVFHILVGLFVMGLGCIGAFFLIRHITTPIRKIVEDVNIISSGDLEHRIGETEITEFVVLETSINTMVDSLKGYIKKIKDDEILQNELIDQLPVAVFMKNVKDGKYVYWNKTSEQIFNLLASDVIGRTDKELFSHTDASIIDQEDKGACLNQIFISNKKIVNKTLGPRTIHLIIVPIFDSTQSLQYILGVGQDVTEESLKMKIDLLFSITRGDILDQLSVIVNYLERAQLKTSAESMQAFFEKTLESIESIRNQIKFVRSLQDLRGPSPVWQSVKKSFLNAVTLISPGKVDIHMELDDFEMYADSLLSRVFYNLLVNSIQHGEAQLTKIRLSSYISGESLTLVYEDNGAGIPVNEKEQIFEFGYGRGTGFGLFLVRELLGYTGITITESGEPGKGAKFEIVVPKGKFRKAKSE